MSLLALPRELLEHIIDYLHDDPASLRACALAHSHLRAPSQLHLIDRVTLKTLACAVSLGEAIQRTPALALCVRELRLLDHNLLKSHDALGMPLPHLRILRFEPSLAGPLWFHTADLCNFASAMRLVLGTATRFAHMSQLATLVRALPALNRLDFMRVSVGEPGLRGVHPPPSSLRLMHLNLCGITADRLLTDVTTWLCESGQQPLAGLESLHIKALLPPALLLHSVAPSLKYLNVQLTHSRFSAYPCCPSQQMLTSRHPPRPGSRP
jgi:hypothetical protein